MKKNQWIYLTASVALGLVWIFLLQSTILLNSFPGILQIPGGNLADYLQFGSSPAFQVFWFGCISALLIWISVTWSRKPRSSIQTRKMQPMWWLAAGLLTIYGWFCLGWFTVLQWQVTGTSPVQGGPNFYPLPTGGWLLLMFFVVIDVVLLFWLPTLLASPRNYRLVVPGAVKLLGSR